MFSPDPVVVGVISRTEVELVDDPPPTDPSMPVENLIFDPEEIDAVVVVFTPLTPPGIKPLDLDLSDPPPLELQKN